MRLVGVNRVFFHHESLSGNEERHVRETWIGYKGNLAPRIAASSVVSGMCSSAYTTW
jgi:hypothetical protein